MTGPAVRKQVIFRQATPTADIRFTHGEGPRASANKVSVYNCGFSMWIRDMFQIITASKLRVSSTDEEY